MDEYRGGEDGGLGAKHSAPHMVFNVEGLLGVCVMCGPGARVYAGISLFFLWWVSIKEYR